MKDTRHPHPHLDPRQPQNGQIPRTNPPVFAWKPRQGQRRFALQVARDPDFTNPVIELGDLTDPLHLPERALPPGTYWWHWSADGEQSQVFSLTIDTDATIVEIPPAAEWLARLPKNHPRIYLQPDQSAALRADPPPQWPALRTEAEAQMLQSHEIAEPEFLPSRDNNYAAFWKIWYPTMWGTRRFVKGAETLALAWLLSGEERFGRAACQRMASIAQWDPEAKGSSHIDHNDEAHMSVIWHGSHVCDWVWDLFTESERAAVIEQFRRRGQITFEHMHDLGHYGIDRFDSHSGREIVFLAQLALVFHEHIPEAGAWLEWLRPVLCGLWPSWAGDDGAWAQGPSYGLAYVTIMTMFTSALKRGTGIDLYRRPFWQNHARWRQWCLPPYAEWMGFGDHSERWASSWNNNADLVDLIGRETGTGEFNDYVADFRHIAETLTTPPERQLSGVNAQLLLAPASAKKIDASAQDRLLHVFADTGWAALRSDRTNPERDIALIFRSSPYGAISHSHANNNDFILHAGGKVLAMPSGYYAGYGSDHHAHWVWHTKSHNCLTLSDASQLMRSPESVGHIVHAYENEHLTYFCGIADQSYQDRATRCRRHVIYLKKPQCFAMVDEFVARENIVSSLQWNIHSWNPFTVDEDRRAFSLEREDSSLTGHFLWGGNGFFSLSEGWDPPPMTDKGGGQCAMQYPLRYTPSGLTERRNLGVILCPGHKDLEKAAVQTRREGTTEVAQIGSTELKVFGGGGADIVAELLIEKTRFAIGDQGLVRL